MRPRPDAADLHAGGPQPLEQRRGRRIRPCQAPVPPTWTSPPTTAPAGKPEDRRYLQRAGGHYVTGEKLRSQSGEAKAVLARQGRDQAVASNLEVKEVVLDEGTMRDRFVVCRNPAEAVRDASVRGRLLGGSRPPSRAVTRSPPRREKLACDLRGR